MRVVLVQRTGSSSATVRLTPSWIARLFGARTALCELEATQRDVDGEIRWRYTATGRRVRDTSRIDHRILLALERMPVSDPPRAIARQA